MWFWLYKIKVFNQIHNDYEIVSGLTVGSTIIEALQQLREYYDDDNIVDILAFRAVTETVFPFAEAMMEEAFNFTITEDKED